MYLSRSVGNAAAPQAGFDPSTTSQSASLWLAIAASVALVGVVLLTSPPRFSEAHREDTSPLKYVVAALALTAPSADAPALPTLRLMYIRNLFFYTGASVLVLFAGFHLVTSRQRPNLAADDLLDGPYFWWLLLMLVSVVTSWFADARAADVCMGQVIVRFMHFAWWWPLAALLAPRHVRGVLTVLLAALATAAGVGIWYYLARAQPGTRLEYPFGNTVFSGACLLPGVFVGLGLVIGHLRRCSPAEAACDRDGSTSQRSVNCAGRLSKTILVLLALALIVAALALTKARSAFYVGLPAGVIGAFIFAAPRKARLYLVLLGLVAAIFGSQWVHDLRESGVMGDRAHSVRSRLDYEWPYALTLFFQKPVGGHGEGRYAMLAGSMARDDQLKDPSVVAVENEWTVHVHNEWLELLADIGIAGAAAFLLAIVMTLLVALRYCDRLRGEADSHGRRWLAIGLAAAMIAVAIEECSSPAMRHPGLAPIFLTVWACLWALVRGERAQPRPVADEARLGVGSLRLFGLAAVIAAVALGYWGIQDWRAARANFDRGRLMEDGKMGEAIAASDFAAAHALDPFQQLIARVQAVQSRSAVFTQRLDASRQTKQPLTNEQLAISQEAWIKLDQLGQMAPRFLGVSSLAADLSLKRSIAHRARGEIQIADEFYGNYVAWLDRARTDEPFRVDLVELLWREKRNAKPMNRLVWLRCLLRRGGMEPRLQRLLKSLGTMPGSAEALEDLLTIARVDRQSRGAQWQDELSPETLRVAAVVAAWSARFEEAVTLASQAEAMYAQAGGRLFVAHSAAVTERVEYELLLDPTIDTDKRLRALIGAHEIMEGPLDEQDAEALLTPLPRGPGKLRLRVLLAAGREADAEKQIRTLDPVGETPMPGRLAKAFAELAEQFAWTGRHLDAARQWTRRAGELDPKTPEVHRVNLYLALQDDDEAKALAAAKTFVTLVPQKNVAYLYLQRAEARWPTRGIWADLRQAYEDYPELPRPATQPAPQPPP